MNNLKKILKITGISLGSLVGFIFILLLVIPFFEGNDQTFYTEASLTVFGIADLNSAESFISEKSVYYRGANYFHIWTGKKYIL